MATAAAIPVTVMITIVMTLVVIAAATAPLTLIIVMLVRGMIAVLMIAVLMITVFMITVLMIVMAVRGGGGGVSAAFRIERSLDGDRAPTQRLHHRLDFRIAANAQALADDLHRQLPMAEMPGDSCDMRQIGAADFGQRFGRGHHLDQAAIIELQRVAAAQSQLKFEIELKGEPACAGQRSLASAPLLEIKNDGVGRGLGPVVLPQNSAGADHLVFRMVGIVRCRRQHSRACAR